MCGIVGYTGKKESSAILISGLKALEYRGYDSAGLAVEEKDGYTWDKVKIRVTGEVGYMINKNYK